MNLVIVLGVMCALNATFTLPSIAGIVLTIGTAVDANVLIFERLREEQHKGLPLRMALRNSYDQALSAIIDSNMTSIITSLCLYAFGSEEVKGFGLTLIIGILASLFTALYVTKTVFGLMIDHVRHEAPRQHPADLPQVGQVPQSQDRLDGHGLDFLHLQRHRAGHRAHAVCHQGERWPDDGHRIRHRHFAAVPVEGADGSG